MKEGGTLMNLTDRLLKVASLVKGKKIADIGTDHGYLPIFLLENNIIDYAVCSDVKKGPLANAEKNIKKYGFENKTRLCLADGLSGIMPNECDTAVIAGMGGEMITHILQEGIPDGIEKFVLQPMRNIDVLRRKIHSLDMKITGENLVKEKDKFYIIICAEKGIEKFWSNEQYIVSPFLRNDPLWSEYSEKEKRKLLRNLTELEKSDDIEKRKEIEKLISLFE